MSIVCLFRAPLKISFTEWTPCLKITITITIIASAILLFRNATTENRSVNWTTVNCPRGGDKKQCQIPTWGVGTPGSGGGGRGGGMKFTSAL